MSDESGYIVIDQDHPLVCPTCKGMLFRIYIQKPNKEKGQHLEFHFIECVECNSCYSDKPDGPAKVIPFKPRDKG